MNQKDKDTTITSQDKSGQNEKKHLNTINFIRSEHRGEEGEGGGEEEEKPWMWSILFSHNDNI